MATSNPYPSASSAAGEGRIPLTARIKQTATEISETGRSAGIASRPLFGRLPLKRVIPQDVHSLMDYAGSAACALAALASSTGEAKASGWALATAGTATSLSTDYRLSAAKLIPIEVHEAIDYGWSLMAIAAPFLFGFSKRDRLATLVHVMVGASTIAASLFTDYRAQRGVRWGKSQLPRPEATFVST